MTALVRRTYVITCDEQASKLTGKCLATIQLVVPDANTGAASEWVRRRLRALSWTYVGGRGYVPRHYCPKHRPIRYGARGIVAPKHNNEG